MVAAPVRGFLENWRYNIWLFLACSYEGVWHWLTIAKYQRFQHDPVTIFGVACVLFVTAAIAIRSPFLGDRVALGAAACAFGLKLVRMAHLTRDGMFAVHVAESCMLTIAAAACLVLLVRSLLLPDAKRAEN
jgi:hypothetical protein